MKNRKPDNPSGASAGRGKPVPTATPSTQARRRLLKQLAAGGGVIAGGVALPERWRRPLVQSVILPAHAAASPMAPPLPPGGTPSPTASEPCGDGSGETFGSGCGGTATWDLVFGEICCVVADPESGCPGVCSISTNSQVRITGSSFDAIDGQEVTAAWDNSQNPPKSTVSGGALEVIAGNMHQGCDTLRLIRDPDGDNEVLCSQVFFGVPTGPCRQPCV